MWMINQRRLEIDDPSLAKIGLIINSLNLVCVGGGDTALNPTLKLFLAKTQWSINNILAFLEIFFPRLSFWTLRKEGRGHVWILSLVFMLLLHLIFVDRFAKYCCDSWSWWLFQNSKMATALGTWADGRARYEELLCWGTWQVANVDMYKRHSLVNTQWV